MLPSSGLGLPSWQPPSSPFCGERMRIEAVPVDRINPAPYNPRRDLKPGDPAYEKIQRSIGEFGLVEPLVWNERTGNLVGGHQRLNVLLEQGATEVECSVVSLPAAKERALNVALNKVQGEWDMVRLKDLLEELDTGEFDLSLTGFDEAEIERLMTQFRPPDLDQEGPGGLRGLGNPVVAYNIIFEDEAQQQAWFGFVRWLKREYPGLETLGARLHGYITSRGYGES